MGDGGSAVAKRTTRKQPVSRKPNLDEVRQQLIEQAKSANAGDATAMSLLRQTMKELPWLISGFGGNLAERANRSLIDSITGKHLIQKEAIFLWMEQMRVELAGPNPSAMERLLVDRVVTCWLQTQHADYMVARADSDDSQRRQDRAQRRFLSAVKTLATVRKMALPIRVDVSVAASVETKSAEPAQSGLHNWDRITSTN